MRNFSEDYLDTLKARAADYLQCVHGINNPYTAFSSPWREDRHPSCSLDRETYYVKDFGRDVSYDVFAMCRLDFNAETFPKQVEEAARVLGVPVEKRASSSYRPKAARKPKAVPEPRKCPEPITGANVSDAVTDAAFNLHETQGAHALVYLHKRGFSDEEITCRYGLGWVEHPKVVNPEWTSFPYNAAGYVVLPFPSSDDFEAVCYCVFRPLFEHNSRGQKVGKELKPKGTAPIYREYRLCEPGQIYVTEGIYDAMSLEILYGVRACALCGCGGDTRLLDVLANTPRSKRPRLILALDDDKAGQKYKDTLTTGLKAIGAAFENALPYPHDCKDYNDVLKLERGIN